MTLVEKLALLNAVLNGTSGVLLMCGYVAIRTKRIEVHRKFMWSAFCVSCAFLVSYVTRFSLSGDTKFLGQGWLRPVYFTILISHIFLAVFSLPMVLRTLFLAQRKRYKEHKRAAKFTFPVWLYVSVTGVIVYLMLYQL